MADDFDSSCPSCGRHTNNNYDGWGPRQRCDSCNPEGARNRDKLLAEQAEQRREAAHARYLAIEDNAVKPLTLEIVTTQGMLFIDCDLDPPRTGFADGVVIKCMAESRYDLEMRERLKKDRHWKYVSAPYYGWFSSTASISGSLVKVGNGWYQGAILNDCGERESRYSDEDEYMDHPY